MSVAWPNPFMRKKLTAKSIRGARGFTLIELVLVLALVATLLGSTISLMTIVKRSDQQAKRSFQTRRDIRRFADDVRRDLHSASKVQIQGTQTQGTGVLVVTENQTPPTTYEIRPGTVIVRVVGDSATHERYDIGIEAKVDVKWLEVDRLIQWTITEANPKRQPIVIVSALGSKPS